MPNRADLGGGGIAQTDVQRQLAGEFPLVIDVGRENPIAIVLRGIRGWVLRIGNLSLDLRSASLEERGQTGERPVAAYDKWGPGILPQPGCTAANLDAVCARAPDHVIAELELIGDKVERQRSARADRRNTRESSSAT